MNNTEQQESESAKHFEMMAEYWNLVAQQAHSEWKTMKFVKKKNGGPGHRSKSEFDEYRRFVYQNHKLFLHRAGLCKAVQTSLLTAGDFDFSEFEPESSLKRAGKIILGNFKRLKP